MSKVAIVLQNTLYNLLKALFHPDKSRETRVAALGGHSIEVEAPPGHFPLGTESLTQLAPLTHRTSATKDILNAGFLCQQSRRGGINLCTGKNSYKEGASHEIEIIADAAHQDGHEFFGNRFSDVVFAMGKWTHGHWDGKVGLKFLKFCICNYILPSFVFNITSI